MENHKHCLKEIEDLKNHNHCSKGMEHLQHHKHCSNGIGHLEGKISFLDNPERRSVFPPEELLEMIPIKKTDNVLDLGAGTGYLTIPAAQVSEGTVYALDIDPKMLKIIDTKAKNDNITNIKCLEGSLDDIKLSDSSIDVVLASLVLHEINPLSKAFKQVKDVLKEGGHFLCLEFEKEESSTNGAPSHIRIHSSTMEQELINVGFTIEQKLFPKDSLYVIIAKK